MVARTGYDLSGTEFALIPVGEHMRHDVYDMGRSTGWAIPFLCVPCTLSGGG